jgi:predicted secreted protein
MNVPVFDAKEMELTAADNGKSFYAAPGATFQVRLRQCRGCPSSWKIIETDNDKVQLLREEYINPSCTNCTGGNHDHQFFFKVKGKGKFKLSFTYFSEKASFDIISE